MASIRGCRYGLDQEACRGMVVVGVRDREETIPPGAMTDADEGLLCTRGAPPPECAGRPVQRYEGAQHSSQPVFCCTPP